jgi:hypothetical protein
MDYNEENMAAEEATEAAVDELLTDDQSEEVEESDESLDSLMGKEGEEQSVEEQEPEQKGTTEPGYVQKRIDKALARERESMRAEIMAQVEAQYAPIRERLLEMDAQELVRKGEVKSLELAKEIVRYRQGQPAQQEAQRTAEQPRQQNGRFAPKQDPVMQAQINLLAKQAAKIKEKTGIDVIAIMDSDSEIKRKITSGEMDFYEVAEQAKKQPGRRKPPAPMRSPNGVNGQIKGTIMSMTDEQFEMREKRLKEGGRFRE